MSIAFRETLPKELVTHVSAICGKDGEEWLELLPETINALERRWLVEVSAPFPGIEYNFVAPATNNGGHDVVVKISPPFENAEILGEAKYLRLRNGKGTIRLLNEDRELKALLLERALPGETLFETFKLDPPGCVRPAIHALRSVTIPVPDDLKDVCSLHIWFEKFRRYNETAFPKGPAEEAFEIYERLSDQPGRTFYIHGDFHPGNIVTATRAEYLVIDPKGIGGHLGYDIAVFLNNLHWWQRDKPSLNELLEFAICRFAEAFDFETRELREWAYAYMVIGAWWNFDEMPDLYSEQIAISDIWGV